MKFKHKILCLLSIFILVLTIHLSASAEAPIPESELYNQAYDLSLQKDYPNAIALLHKLLSLYPGTQNEDVYWKLAQIYDENLYDYQKALEVYHIYMKKFPEGRFYTNFKERVDYLTKNQPDWDAIRAYKQLSDTSYTRPVDDNIKMLRELLEKYPHSVVAPEIYNWLALQYQQTFRYKEASQFIQKYINTFPANGKTDTDLIMAYEQYAKILYLQRQYNKAFQVLKETLKYNVSPVEYTENRKIIRKELIIWIGDWISFIYIALFMSLFLILRPWRESSFKFEPARLIKWALLIILGTLLPMLAVFKAGFGIWKTFYGLTFTGGVLLILLRLSAPLAGKLNRSLYLFMSFMLIIVGIYLTFYWGDTLSVYYQMPQF